VFPPWLARALHYVPVAVLSALVVPMALAPGGSIALPWQNPYLIGTVCAGALAWYSGRTLPALLASFALFGALRYFA
jgi:branched-subunit amino acid transport protein